MSFIVAIVAVSMVVPITRIITSQLEKMKTGSDHNLEISLNRNSVSGDNRL